MNNIPKRLKILGKYFKVTITTGEDINNDYGECNIDTCEIKIRTNQHTQQAKDTLLHESIHAIDDMLNLGMTEKQVHSMATGLYALIHDNKHFAKWLMEKNNNAKNK